MAFLRLSHRLERKVVTSLRSEMVLQYPSSSHTLAMEIRWSSVGSGLLSSSEGICHWSSYSSLAPVVIVLYDSPNSVLLLVDSLSELISTETEVLKPLYSPPRLTEVALYDQ